jgi:hypothetical protein
MARIAEVERFALGERAELGLGVFLSESCPVCASLAPGLRTLQSDPHLALASFDERTDAELWTRLEIPGSPYAVAIDPDGTVLAKGTFNNLAQLESVIATAERRRAEAVGV